MEALSESELLVMKVIWHSQQAMSIQEITALLNRDYGKDWKIQTVSTFLGRMVKNEYLSMTRKGRTFLYEPLVSEDAYGKKEIAKCVKLWGDGRMDLLMASFSQVRPFTKEEKEQIRSLLDGMD